jgi:hypothetical protein
MIRAFNKHYRKAIDLLESASGSEKIEMAEKVMEWFRELPEEYLISLALFFNEVIDDLGDDSLEKINFGIKRKKKEEERVMVFLVSIFVLGRSSSRCRLLLCRV